MKQESTANNYRPLIVIISMILLASFALSVHRTSTSQLASLMHYFMGLFFAIFAMFKFFNLSGFADGFQMYDIIAKRIRIYAYAYPLIELILGLSYLSGYFLYVTYWVTLILMIISAVGVIRSVMHGMNLKCACLGTTLDVPLSTVSIIENVGMGVMAGLMILFM